MPNGARIIEIPSGVFLDSDGPLPEANSGLCGSQILLTSGTTGTYKRLELDSAAEDRRNAERARLWRFDATTVNHGVDLGLWTAIGFKQPAAVWHAGGTVVFDQGLEPFTRFFRHGVNRVYFLSSMLAKLLEAQRGAPAPANVEIAIGAGFLPLPLAQRALATLCSEIRSTYGTTETVTHALEGWVRGSADLFWLTLMPGREIEIVDDEGGPCRAGTAGAVRVRLNALDCSGYLDDPVATAAAFRDGWFYPGDLAVKRSDGRVRVLGRVADVVNFQGSKLAVAPIEAAIARRLKASEVCLFSGLDDRGREEVVIAVESETPPPAGDLEKVARRFQRFGQVRVVIKRRLPRGTTGKVLRLQLRQTLFGEGGANGAS